MGFFKPAHFLIPGKKFCGEKKIIKLKEKKSFIRSYITRDIQSIKSLYNAEVPTFSEIKKSE